MSTMRAILIPATVVLAIIAVASSSTPAPAAGCLKGAVIGVAGHYAGHHGLLGAGAGCVIGHHEAKKHAREHAEQQSDNGGSHEGSGGGAPDK
jgi:predicted transcriptional regulator with HTH domain